MSTAETLGAATGTAAASVARYVADGLKAAEDLPDHVHDHRARARFLLGALGVLLVLFAGRIVQWQAFDARELSAEAIDARTRELLIPAKRGAITDSRGVALASTVERSVIAVDPKIVGEYKRDGKIVGVNGAAADLAPLLSMRPSDLTSVMSRAKTEAGKDIRYAVLAREVLPEVSKQIRALGIPGITSEPTYLRQYPAGAVAGNILGYVNQYNEAKEGLELKYDDILRGTDGYRSSERDRRGREIPTGEQKVTESTPGSDVVLTIDRDVQWHAQEVITDAVRASGAQWGTVVVINPKTGDIVALADSHSFNPSDASSFKGQRGSRALSDVIEPGSTAKVITAAAAIEEGIVTPKSRFKISDKYTTSNKQQFRDSHSHDVEPLTFTGILAQSSNTGTVIVGEKLSKQQRYDYLTKFGFGQSTGLDFPGQTKGILAPPGKWDGRQEFTVLFGQGVSANAIQSAQVFSTIANGGVRMTPRLVAGTARDGVFTPDPRDKGVPVVSEPTARQVRLMLESAVADGTGGNAEIPGYRVAGKTGTSQAPKDGGYEGYTASFIGMAPAENPALVVAVTLQRPTRDYYGGTVAAPVFQDVMSYALSRLKIPPSTQKPTLYSTTWK